MKDLDDINRIKKIDQGKALTSIEHLSHQCKQAWNESLKVKIPESFQKVRNIVISGMGGSSYGARIVKSLYQKDNNLSIPVVLANGYCLPGFVNSNTLVILSSYSGNTEETLVTAIQAKEKKAKILVLTSGGKLASFLKKNSYPGYIFNPRYNPSGQPRIGVGYMIIGLIGLLARLKKIPVTDSEIYKIIKFLDSKTEKLGVEAKTDKNPAKTLAKRIKNKIPIILASSYFEGAVYGLRNMFHETAKQFAVYFPIPEANHHLLEGLAYPKSNRKNLIVLFLLSKTIDQKLKKRLTLTKEVVKKNNINTEMILLSGISGLGQTMEIIQLGSWLTFYLAMLNNIDPTEIPWVDYFKENLHRRVIP